MAAPSPRTIVQQSRRANALAERGDLTSAAAIMIPLIEHARDMPDVVTFYAALRARQGYYEEAAGWYRHVLKSNHGHVATRQSLALCLRRAGRFDESIAQIERIRERDRWNPMAVLMLIDTHSALGRREEALALLGELESNVPAERLDDEGRARMQIIRLRLEDDAATAELARAGAANRRLHSETRSSLFQHAGMAFQKLGRHGEAFAAFAEAKSARGLRFDSEGHERRVGESIAFWSSPEASSLPVSGVDGSRYIFIVGMPRSGTSLLEQMLGRIEGVTPLGERGEILRAATTVHYPSGRDLEPIVSRGERITAESMATLGGLVDRGYREAAGPGGHARLVDKQVFNFFHLPLIARLLPGAMVLHTVRHPCDTALSCFGQWFNRQHPFLADVATLGRYYAQYERLMGAWRSLAAPAGRPAMLDVCYEALVSDPERVMRGVLEFLGLPWDASVLSPEASDRVVRTNSREQVRRAINTSAVGRWRAYEAELGPFMDAVGRDSIAAAERRIAEAGGVPGGTSGGVGG
jgi:hypothetical protein